MKDSWQRLKTWVDESDNIVFFGGAGVSTESGIPDFRSSDGLFNQKYDYPPEVIVSHSFFQQQPEVFFQFLRERMIFPDAQPNAAHRALARLEQQGKLRAVITQNIDGLHQLAGSKNVLELHGSMLRHYCLKCNERYGLDFVMSTEGIPRCACGGIVRPDVVLYEEGLDQQLMLSAVRAIEEADVLIIGGTSLVVYPAAGLVDWYRGKRLVLINRDASARTAKADLIVNDPIGEVLQAVVSD